MLELVQAVQAAGEVCVATASYSQLQVVGAEYGLSRPPSEDRLTFMAHWGISERFASIATGSMFGLVFVPLIQPIKSEACVPVPASLVFAIR